MEFVFFSEVDIKGFHGPWGPPDNQGSQDTIAVFTGGATGTPVHCGQTGNWKLKQAGNGTP